MHELKEGWHLFISTAAISLYTTSNTFILGLLTNNVSVGYYSAAEKLVNSVLGLLYPVSQAIYPYISRLVSDSKEGATIFIRKALILIGCGSFAASSGLFLFANLIVYFILGPHFSESVIVLRILAFLPFVIALSNVLGIQTMITFNMKKAFSNILISAGVINIVLAIILVPHFQHVGTAVGVMATETYVTAAMSFFLLKKGTLRVGCNR
jgi:polysaccharide transporter, PST family